MTPSKTPTPRTATSWPPLPRGYFAIGAERMSKSLNLGNLMRSAHGFGASFTFTVGATYRALEAHADTSKGQLHLPHYNWSGVEELTLPQGCRLVGIELIEDAVDLPSFRHPLRAAYVLGPEMGSLSPPLLARCDHVVKIPTRFCINVAMAGAIVMYDRVRSLAHFADRPMWPGGPDSRPATRDAGRKSAREG
ncbi:MAG: RNA methyltransferase [Hyphomicrobiaceae bacterium]